MPTVAKDVLTLLPWLTWAGLKAPPYDNLKCSWKNALGERLIPYVPGAVHDDLSRHPFKLTADLLFYTGLGPATANGQQDNFPAYFNTWMPFLVNGAVNTLGHPVLGPVRARVEDVNFELKSTVRSGTKVTVSWTDTVEDPADLDLLGFTNTQLPTTNLATLCDAAAAPFGITYASGLSLGPTATQFGISLSIGQLSLGIIDVLAAMSSSVTIGSLVSNSLLNAFQGGVGLMVDKLFALNSPYTYQATDLLISFWIALDNQRQQLAVNARATKIYVPGNRTTIDSIARTVGNTVQEIIQLNVQLLFSPGVPKATPVRYYLQG